MLDAVGLHFLWTVSALPINWVSMPSSLNSLFFSVVAGVSWSGLLCSESSFGNTGVKSCLIAISSFLSLL